MASDQLNPWEFFLAVGHHWVTLMSGGVVIVLLGLFERFSGRNIPWLFYAVIVISLVVSACYLAWREERKETLGFVREHSLPVIGIEIAEAILTPTSRNSVRCFLRVTVRNLTPDAPCMIETAILKLQIGGQWHASGTLLSAASFQLVTCTQLYDPNEVPLNQPFHYEDGLPVIESAKEDLSDLRSVVEEEHPLKRGFPKSG